MLIAGIPNATLWFFGTDELLGHLPVYGAMLVLLSTARTRSCGRRYPRCGPSAPAPGTARAALQATASP